MLLVGFVTHIIPIDGPKDNRKGLLINSLIP
jgi:hypothetical protein